MTLSKNLILAAFAVTTLAPLSVMAAAPAKNQGYLIDAPAATIVTSTNGLCWHTGAWTQGTTSESCDPSKKPIAAIAPAPEPIVVAAAAPQAAPLPQKISFSGDALFAFDQSVLKPEGMTMLDGLVRQLDGATFDSIVATGHTDRYGSNSYNQKLSERRAQVVKEYLISKNVQASRIDAAGKGELEPVTQADDCQGAKSAKVVACLQPDRRVDVELTGAKTVISSL